MPSKALGNAYKLRDVIHAKDPAFGAKGDGSTDDTTALQALIDHATLNGVKAIWSPAVYLISAALVIGGDMNNWALDGQGATLKQATDNTPIIQFSVDGVNEQMANFSLKNFVMRWSNNQSSSNTAAVGVAFTTTVNNTFGVYNGEFHDLRVVNGYRGIGHTDAALTMPVWGCKFTKLRFEALMTGEAIRLKYSGGSGMPNNEFDLIYADASAMTGNAVISLNQQRSVKIDNFEVNNLAGQRALLLETCFHSNVGVVRIEGGTQTTASIGLVECSECRGTRIAAIEVQSLTVNSGGGTYAHVFRDSSASKHLATHIGSISVTNSTMTNTLTLATTTGNKVFIGDFNYGSNTGTILQVDNTADANVRNVHHTLLDGLHFSADAGNADKTLYIKDVTNGTSPTIVRYATPITADRAVNLPSVNLFPGARYTVIREATATGAFNVNVGSGPIKALGIGEWVDVVCDLASGGSPTFRELRFGSL